MQWRSTLVVFFASGSRVAASDRPVVLVFESWEYLEALGEGAAADVVELLHCPGPEYCSSLEDGLKQKVVATVGQPANISMLDTLQQVQLVQSASYFSSRLDRVPPRITVAKYAIDYQKDYGAEPIAEFAIASVFEWNYRMRQHSAAFTACAWGADAPLRCPSPQSLTTHPVLMGQTIGILGYGTVGEFLARRSAALGMRTVATKRQGPFEPPPPPLEWLSDDNDRLLRESDFVVVAVPGTLRGFINKTALALMKPNAVLIPLSAGHVDFDALYDALTRRAIAGAVLDVWPMGCWSYPQVECGPPYGSPAEPDSREEIHKLDNVIALPGMMMRDAQFWAASAAFVRENLLALVRGQPLKGVVRNGTQPSGARRGAEVIL